jgi:hypothetical protein
MTRIDLHAPHLPAVRETEKLDAHRGHGEDFLDHLRSDKPAVGEQARRQDAGAPLPAEQQAGAGSETTVTRAAVPGDAAGEASTDGVDVGPALQTDTQSHIARHAPITVAEAGTHARLFEQHWFANGYLSFLADADRSLAPAANGVAGAKANRPTAATTTPETLVPAASMPTGEPDHTGIAPWPVALESMASAADALPRSIERLARTLGPLVAADQPWPERLLRLSQRPGGKAALWVRDYKLMPQSIEPLVAHLRQLARQDGVALDRVVVNGTIVWHAESLKGEA